MSAWCEAIRASRSPLPCRRRSHSAFWLLCHAFHAATCVSHEVMSPSSSSSNVTASLAVPQQGRDHVEVLNKPGLESGCHLLASVLLASSTGQHL